MSRIARCVTPGTGALRQGRNDGSPGGHIMMASNVEAGLKTKGKKILLAPIVPFPDFYGVGNLGHVDAAWAVRYRIQRLLSRAPSPACTRCTRTESRVNLSQRASDRKCASLRACPRIPGILYQVSARHRQSESSLRALSILGALAGKTKSGHISFCMLHLQVCARALSQGG